MKRKIISVLLLCLFLGGLAAPQAEAATIRVTVDGTPVSFDQPPVNENGRVLVPMRALSEALGAVVYWDGAERQMFAVRGTDVIWMQVDNPLMVTDDTIVELDVAPKIIAGRILVPIRALSEGYDAMVVWDGAKQTITVTTDGLPTAERLERQVFDLTNQERAKAGLSPLAWSDALADVARAHSRDMAVRGFFDHTNPDGLSPFDRMHQAGLSYQAAAENIAAGYATPAEVVAGWMASPGHRANILDPNLEELGVGFYAGGSYGTYWTQCFMTPW